LEKKQTIVDYFCILCRGSSGEPHFRQKTNSNLIFFLDLTVLRRDKHTTRFGVCLTKSKPTIMATRNMYLEVRAVAGQLH